MRERKWGKHGLRQITRGSLGSSDEETGGGAGCRWLGQLCGQSH